MMGVVYYANYLRYFEAARNEMLRSAGLTYAELERYGYALPVSSVEVRYQLPARYDDELVIETRVEMLRFGSVHLRYQISRASDAQVLTTGKTVHACVGASGKVVRLPPDLRARLADYMSRAAGETPGAPESEKEWTET